MDILNKIHKIILIKDKWVKPYKNHVFYKSSNLEVLQIIKGVIIVIGKKKRKLVVLWAMIVYTYSITRLIHSTFIFDFRFVEFHNYHKGMLRTNTKCSFGVNINFVFCISLFSLPGGLSNSFMKVGKFIPESYSFRQIRYNTFLYKLKV